MESAKVTIFGQSNSTEFGTSELVRRANWHKDGAQKWGTHRKRRRVIRAVRDHVDL
jgi:hypothetical protein